MIRLIIFLAAIITAINANAEIVDVKQDETTAKYISDKWNKEIEQNKRSNIFII